MPRMNSTDAKDIKKKSQRLSWLLRHGANETGLAMDAGGFAPVSDVLKHVHMTRAELDDVIRDNNKSRYELSSDGLRVRACQGHSMEGTPVTREGLEATWAVVDGDEVIFHGTNVIAARSILADGIDAQARTHVHLAESEGATVGKRANVDVLLAVSPAKMRERGLTIWRAPNGVLLARHVPKEAIVDVVAQNRPGERALAELKALLTV
jgi:putative RNA 2'-phosphotransferase